MKSFNLFGKMLFKLPLLGAFCFFMAFLRIKKTILEIFLRTECLEYEKKS